MVAVCFYEVFELLFNWIQIVNDNEKVKSKTTQRQANYFSIILENNLKSA